MQVATIFRTPELLDMGQEILVDEGGLRCKAPDDTWPSRCRRGRSRRRADEHNGVPQQDRVDYSAQAEGQDARWREGDAARYRHRPQQQRCHGKKSCAGPLPRQPGLISTAPEPSKSPADLSRPVPRDVPAPTG